MNYRLAAARAGQARAPYLDSLVDHLAKNPTRLNLPGHKGGPGADPQFVEAIGRRAVEMDITPFTHGIDVGVEPTPFDEAQALAAEAWGARRTWFLVNGASQGNLAAGLALAQVGDRVVVQRNAHSSTIDALILSGMRPTFVAPELDPELGIAHCLSPEALDLALAETPEAAAAIVTSPTYFGAGADVRGLAAVAHEHGVPLVADEAWGAHLAFHEALPEDALSAGADLVISSMHKVAGSLGQAALLHLGRGGRLSEELVDRAVTLTESTSPSSLLCASLDAARRQAALSGRELLTETIEAIRVAREGIRAIDGLDVLDERICGRPGVHSYDPIRLAIDVRGIKATGYELAPILRDVGELYLELYGQHVVVAVFGMGQRDHADAEALVAALTEAVDRVGVDPAGRAERFAALPPWGELVLTPREAYLGPQEAVAVEDAVGRVAAESLAAYPPGVPNVLPGERLTAETLAYVRRTIELGGSVRGASDLELETVRVVARRVRDSRPSG